jgi:thiamine pyrophosphate-dependent acetolactate synthase large subunit-like protein
MTTASDALLQALRSNGVDTVFGIPGVDNLAFFDALERSGLRGVLVRHEAAAGFAADAYYRITGRPAVCFTTAGPGAANVVTPMAEAWASNSTFLHLTTALPTTYGPRPQPRGLPHFHPRQLDLFKPVAAEAIHVSDPGDLPAAGVRALCAGLEAPHQASYVQVPHDLLSAPVDKEDPGSLAGNFSQPFGTDHEAVSKAVQALKGRTRPLIWAGSGAVDAAESIIRLAEILAAPILLTHGAKRRWAPMDHPLVVAYPPHEPAVAELTEGSDAIVIVGSDLDAMMTRQFTLALPQPRIQIDVVPEHVGMRYPVDHALIGRAEDVVPVLVDLLGPPSVLMSEASQRAEQTRRRTHEGLVDDGRGPLPRAFLDALGSDCPDDAIFVCDMAVAGYWTAGYVDLAPARSLLYPIGWGTLGFGLPAAIGAAVAAPDRRVICVVGDAGLQYHVAELATARQEHLSLLVIVVDDGGYGMLRYAGEASFGRSIASDLVPIDVAAVAKGFGVPAFQADLDGAWREAIAAGLGVDGPAVVHLRGKLVPPRMSVLWSSR